MSRIHSLDSLRAIMMLLGLVLHSAITYSVYEDLGSWPIRNSFTHLSNDFIVSIIHSFRMPIFFLVSGFFGSMLFYERKPSIMIKNRFFRVVLPFIVFIFLLWPTIIFGFGYTTLAFMGINNSFELITSFFSFDLLIPKYTFHLWFLYYLILITFCSVIIAFFLQKTPKILISISEIFNWVFKRPIIRLITFATISSVLYYIIGTYSVITSTSFIPALNMLIFYSSFYIIGWFLFRSKYLLDSFMKYDLFSTLLAVILFTLYFFMSDSFSFLLHVVIKSIILWLFIFGITGLFVRHTSTYSPFMRYLSDASYWVYLVHVSFTSIIPGLISSWPISASLKFLFVFFASSFLCFLSYHYLVRATFIGKFLNGRKYARKLL